MCHLAQGQLLQPFEQAGCVGALVRFNQPNEHVCTQRLLLACGLQHGVSFAHARAGSEKDF